MTGQQPGPRIVPPDEARGMLYGPDLMWWGDREQGRDLAHTAAVLGEQRDAVLKRHRDDELDFRCCECRKRYPCPTARDFGVTE